MGVIDESMAVVAEVLIDTFVDETRAFRRTVTTSSPLTVGPPTVIEVIEQIKTGPVAPYEARELSGTAILTGDQRMVVSRKHLEAKGFDPNPAKDTVVTVQVDGVWLKVVRVNNYKSGDQTAAYELQLRG